MKGNLIHYVTKTIIYIPDIIKYIFAIVVSSFYRKNNIWLLCERGTDARDNAFCFFQYLIDNHKDVNAYYLISIDSPDRKRLLKYERKIIRYGSFKHYVFYCRASVLISTHIHGYAPNVNLFDRLDKIFSINRNKFTVSLKHGVTKDYIPVLNYEYSKLNLLVCAASPEYEYMKKTYGYPKNNLQYLGFCRFDRLHNLPSVKRQILIMPTWRSWLKDEDFKLSDYYKYYNELLNNDVFLEYTKNQKYQIIFYPHHEIQPYVHLFKTKCNYNHLIIADKYHYDVQELLKESALLITDYSSVFFDFAYMKKPVIFYQFDFKKYRNNHYSKGYFDYEDSFGPVTHDVIELLSEIKNAINEQCKMPLVYLKKVEEFFPLYDNNNCKRIYEYIRLNS